jgi:HPt (histidine-containing phosphotransfer) domain-containing protein
LFNVPVMDYKFINTEYLDSVSGGDPEITNEIVVMFREQSVEIYNEMNLHLAAKNYHALGMLAHKAKSSVAIMGMNDLASMLKSFELQAKEDKEPEKYASYIDRFKMETDGAVTELETLVKTMKNK